MWLFNLAREVPKVKNSITTASQFYLNDGKSRGESPSAEDILSLLSSSLGQHGPLFGSAGDRLSLLVAPVLSKSSMFVPPQTNQLLACIQNQERSVVATLKHTLKLYRH